MKTAILVLDESGAKGYDSNEEQYHGEFGVMAGFVLPECILGAFTDGLSQIVEPFTVEEQGKLHITDLAPSAQERLRGDLFEYFKRCELYWFYEAISVQGFHVTHANHKQISQSQNQARHSTVKLSQRPSKESLHRELFWGLFGRGVEFSSKCLGSTFHLRVVTDRVDESILKMFATVADEFLCLGEVRRITVPGYDTEKEDPVEGVIYINVVSGSDVPLNEMIGDYSGVTYDIQCDDNVLTLAADVLANSVHYYLKKRQTDTPGAVLNAKQAIQGHPLQEFVVSSELDGGVGDMADILFKHPRQR